MKSVKLLVIGAFVSVSLVSGSAQAMFTGKAQKGQVSKVESVPGEYVVQARGARAVAGLRQKLGALGLSIKEMVNAKQGLMLVKTKAGLGIQSVRDVRRAVQALPDVRFIEPNYIYRAFETTPNDLHFGKLWGMRNQGQNDPSGRAGKAGADIKATEAWSINTGSRDIVVAIIDTGIDYNHEDLRDNMWTSPTGTHGYNAITGSLDPMDDHSHGTHCAGTIGGTGNNALGVTGVNWNVRLMGVKFLSGSGGGTLADAVKAIDWATGQKVNVMSNSWGGGGFSQALEDAIKRARDQGILFVAAAGNDSSDNDASPAYPASYQIENVVSVAASNNLDAISYFSNWGKNTVHLMAPGENIWSSTPGNTYQSFSGTSMACPHVAGASALLMATEPGISFADVKARLMTSTDKTRAFRNKLISMGRLNINNLLQNITPPGPVIPPESSWSAPIAQAISTPHPYADRASQRWTISHPGAAFLRLRFARFELESGYDFVNLYDAEGNLQGTLSGNQAAGTWTDEIQGDTVVVEFVSDESVPRYGFDLDAYGWTNFNGQSEVQSLAR
jgi:thermitase